MFFTYIHRKVTDNSVFYVGCGKKYRATDFIWRSDKWKKAAASGVYSEMVASWKTRREALDHEKLLILCFKDMGYELANQYVGGKKGIVLGPYSKSHAINCSLAKTGVKRKPFSLETKQKMSIAQAKRWTNKRVEA